MIVRIAAVVLVSTGFLFGQAPARDLFVGFGAEDITPLVGKDYKPVYIAGFGKDRKATGVHDPLFARAIVLRHGDDKIAVVSVDLVGLFHTSVEKVRTALPRFRYVLVSSTHNHEGPDSLGIWGPSLFFSGADPAYVQLVEQKIVAAVRQADSTAQPARAVIGQIQAPELVHDSRLPIVKHDELVALRFLHPTEERTLGLVVNWHCHPESLDSRNTELSADFVTGTVGYLKRRYGCPVVYLTGTVGGLMGPLGVQLKDEAGEPLANGTFAKTERYGQLIGMLAEKSLTQARPIALTPFQVQSRSLYLPLDNAYYVLSWQLGVLERQAFLWSGDPSRAEPVAKKLLKGQKMAIRTELGWLRLGQLDVAAIPGEIYPELVLGKVQDPPDAGADFPDAPIEPAIFPVLKASRKNGDGYRMLVGLANDEIGYIIPKRQWDEKPPYCYGRKTSQYGEINSLGPETAPLLCKAFAALVNGMKEKR